LSGILIASFKALGDFWRKGCSSLAASIAFFFLLSLLLYFLGQFLSSDPTTSTFLETFIRRFFPDLNAGKASVAEGIQRLAPQLRLHWMMVVAFLWAATQVFAELDNAVNVVFEAGSKRHPVVSTIISVLLLGLSFLVLLISYVTTQTVDFLTFNAPQVAELHRLAIIIRHVMLAHVLPFGLVLSAVSLLYRFLPHLRPSWQKAFAGGLLFAMLWELAKHLFSRYIVHFSRLGQMYGSLLTVVLALLWVYYSAVLFLYCAAVVHRLGINRQKT